MAILLGLDVGTTGARAVAIDDDGAVVASAKAEYPLAQPRPGWAEQDPDDWWRAAREVLGAVAAAVAGRPIVGLGLTGQMHGATFLDDRERPIRPAILWNDARTVAQCAAITARVGAARLIAIAGNPAIVGFQAPKILWLRDEEPENYARVARVAAERLRAPASHRRGRDRRLRRRRDVAARSAAARLVAGAAGGTGYPARLAADCLRGAGDRRAAAPRHRR